MYIAIIVVLVLLALGAFPRAGAYSANWGYGPTGIVGLIVIVLLVLLLTGRL